MKPKPLLTVFLALALSCGLLWAFPTTWMALVLVLLGLVAVQATVVRRSLTVVRADQGAPALRMSRAVDTSALAPAFANQNGSSAKPALDPAAFARFRAHLETVEQARGLRPDAAKAAAESQASVAGPVAAPKTETKRLAVANAEMGESSSVTDKVALSVSAATVKPLPATPKVKSAQTYGPQRRVVMPGAKPAQPAKGTPNPHTEAASAEDAEGPDLFADLRPTRSGTLPARAAAPLPAPLDELEIRDREATLPDADDAAALLKLAEEALRRGDVDAARAALDQHLGIVPAANVTWPARRLQVRVAVLSDEPQVALDAFEAMTKSGFALTPEVVPALVDELLLGAKPDIADSLRVSVLLKTLAVFRQATDRAAMDAVYSLVIEAQERVGDERKLVQFLKNHLEIKKVMGEASGQLELIDQIGNRLFKLGETAEAREYYELGLKIRAEHQEPTVSAPTKSGTTQTA